MFGAMRYTRSSPMPKEGLHWMFVGTSYIMDDWGGMFICCRIRAHVHAKII